MTASDRDREAVDRHLTCPSAQPDMEDPQVLGVLEPGTDGRRLSYVNGQMPVTDELLESTGPVPPTLVYRFAARCMGSNCVHFDGSRCGLGQRMAERLSATSTNLPPCVIRKTCRWHAEVGPEACLRCSQVITRIDDPSSEFVEIVRPVKEKDECGV